VPRQHKGRARRSTQRKPPPARKRVRRAPATQRVVRLEKAIKEVGEGRIKAGKISVSRSRFVTPTKRGAGAKSVRKVLRAIRRTKVSPIYSYTVKVRFRRRDGERGEKIFPGFGVPLPKSVAARRRKGESNAQALERLIMAQVQRAAHGALRVEWGDRETMPSKRAAKTMSRQSRERARARLRNIKRREKASFQIEFHREVAPPVARGSPSRRGRARLRRR